MMHLYQTFVATAWVAVHLPFAIEGDLYRAIAGRAAALFEYRRDLRGIDAFLGYPQIVIGDHREDGVERAP